MSYEMPAVSLGETVLYRVHEGAEPIMAFVTKVGRETIECWSLSPGYGGVDRTSVHHKDDPALENPNLKAFGTWEHRPRDPRIAQLSERVSALEKSHGGNKK